MWKLLRSERTFGDQYGPIPSSLHIRPTSHGSTQSGRWIAPGPGLLDHPRLLPRPRSLRAPELRWSVHEDAVVRSSLSGIVKGHHLLIGPGLQQAIRWHDTHRFGDFSKGPMVLGPFGPARLHRAELTEALPEGIFLGGFGRGAYYHHLVERVSKLPALEFLPADLRGLPLLVPDEVLEVPGLLDAMALLAPMNQLIGLHRSTEYVVGRLVWIDEPTVWTARDTAMTMHLRAVRSFRSAVLSALSIVPAVDSDVRLFIVRGDVARSSNERELLHIAESLGLNPWRPELASFADQVATWSRAHCVVGDSGAAWTGVIFSPADSVGIIHRFDSGASGWEALAEVGGRGITHLFADGPSRRVDPESFAHCLQRIPRHPAKS